MRQITILFEAEKEQQIEGDIISYAMKTITGNSGNGLEIKCQRIQKNQKELQIPSFMMKEVKKAGVINGNC